MDRWQPRTQQVDFDPARFGNQDLLPLFQEARAAARATNLVRRAQDFDDGNERVGFDMADFQMGFLDFIVDEQRYDDRLSDDERASLCFLASSAPGLLDALVGNRTSRPGSSSSEIYTRNSTRAT